MPYVIIVVALALVASVVALVWFTVRGVAPEERGGVAIRAVVFIAVVFIAFVASMLAPIFYRIPSGVVAGLVVLWVAAGLAAAWLVRALDRGAKTYARVAGMLIATILAATALMMVSPLGAPVALFEVRAAQIAEASGFGLLVPEGAEMITDYLPVTALAAPDAGVSIEYERFTLQERPAKGEAAEADLRALVAPGESPLGQAEVSRDASVTALTVKGRPAVGVTFVQVPKEAAVKPMSSADTATVLVCQVDGVDVRLESHATDRYSGPREGGGANFEHVPALSVAELAAIAETLAPAR
jgi:hypothetical protein